MRFLISSSLLSLIPISYLFSSASSQTIYGTRTFSFENHCDYDVFISSSGGSGPNKNSPPGGSVLCGSTADCRDGMTCVQTGPISQCFWNSPVPTASSIDNSTSPVDLYRLRANETRSLSIPVYSLTGAVWSGVMGGRTGCDETTGACQGCECNDPNPGGVSKWPACPASKGLSPPCAQAEMTLQSDAPDFYDVTLINGWNQAIMMAPTGVTPKNIPPILPNESEAYWCGNPGAPSGYTIAPSQASATWSFVPPTVDFVWVSTTRFDSPSPPLLCETDADCKSSGNASYVCGTSYHVERAPQFYAKTCGEPLGYWTADQICPVEDTYSPSPVDPFKCQALKWLYLCAGPSPASCYQPGASSDCCGCVDWWTKGLPIPPPPLTGTCVNENPIWTSGVLPNLQWIKQGCASCYTYPYDDFSSTFQCFNTMNSTTSEADTDAEAADTDADADAEVDVVEIEVKKEASAINLQGYTISFCPNRI